MVDERKCKGVKIVKSVDPRTMPGPGKSRSSGIPYTPLIYVFIMYALMPRSFRQAQENDFRCVLY